MKKQIITMITALVILTVMFMAQASAAEAAVKTSAKTPNTGAAVAEVATSTVKSPIKKSFIKKTTAEIEDRGDYGRLVIKDAGVDVAVFETTDFSKLQDVVDAEDSACMFNWNDGNTLIADHNYQGFKNLKKVKKNSTYAYMVTEDGVKTYKCIRKLTKGWNDGSTLAFNDHTPIGEEYTGKLIIYTCNNEPGSVTITVWDEVL